jgi:hypothetical protein
MALIVLSAATSCYDYDKQDVISETPVNYINVTLTVSASSAPMTRANTPLGGEDGDGREQGIETRENEVEGVTLIFYRNNAGINASAESAASTPIDFVAYYTTTLVGDVSDRYSGELRYTTGERELKAPLSSDNEYHMLVVANANLEGLIVAGTTTLAQVRDMVRSSVYAGTGVGTNASLFVMTSEEDKLLSFGTGSYNQATNRRIFTFDNIHIERMAARIDFWAKNAAYATDYDHNGYLYSVGTTDHFVLTSITPFNLNMGSGNEYLFKRTSDASSPYLANETTSNWVIDLYTSGKTTSAHPEWMVSTLTTVESSLTNDYNITMEGSQSGIQKVENIDDIIIAYPKENTLNSSSPLYYYATGLAFEGYYYVNGAKTDGERRVYYHYLRHQGDAESYTAVKSPLDKSVTCGSTTPMSYGVVRNNIYRVSIGGITPDDRLILNIKVKKWDKFEHATIYM